MALLGVLLLLMLVSGLGAALAVSATTETLIARNHQVAAQARAAADAGLAHAVAVTLDRLRNWSADGFTTPSAAVTALLRGPDDEAGTAAADADNGSLEALGLVRPPGRIVLGGSGGATGASGAGTAGSAGDASYDVRLLDDDSRALGRGLSDADVARIGEDGQAATDLNALLVIRATGYAGTAASPRGAAPVANAEAPGAVVASGAVAVADATLALRQLPAVVANGAMRLDDTALVGGPSGGVHANGDLTLAGRTVVTRDATATGTVIRSDAAVVGGRASGQQAPLPVPAVRAAAFRSRAGFVLAANGVLRTADGTVLCDASGAATACADAGHAWEYRGAAGWTLPGTLAPPPGTYYAESDVVVSGSPGNTVAPARLTVIAEGSISITGPAILEPDTTGVLLVADGDVLVTDGRIGVGAEGQILVREQARIAGSATVAGQLLIENERSVSPLVGGSAIAGSATLTFSGANAATTFVVVAWQRVIAP